MATTVPEIMTALGDRLSSVEGLRGLSYAPDNPAPPCAFPLVPAIPSYRESMRRGAYLLPFRIALLTGAQLDRTSQHRLAAYSAPLGPLSVRAALEDTDRTLGGLVDDLIVDSFDPGGLQEVGAVGYLGGTFAVRIYASGA